MRSACSSHVTPFAHTIPRFGTLGVLGHVGAVPGTPRVSERISAFRDTRCFGTDFGVSGHLVFWNGFRRFGTPRRPEDTSRRPGDAGCPRPHRGVPGTPPDCPETPFGVSGHQVSQNAFLCFGTARGVLGTDFCGLGRRRTACDGVRPFCYGAIRAGTQISVPAHQVSQDGSRPSWDAPEVSRNAISCSGTAPGGPGRKAAVWSGGRRLGTRFACSRRRFRRKSGGAGGRNGGH